MDAEVLKKYRDIDWNALLRKDLGKHSLETAKPDLDKIKQIFDGILEYANLNDIPDNYLRDVESGLDQWRGFCQEVRNFSDISQKQNFINIIKEHKASIFRDFNHIIHYVQTFDPRKNEQAKKIDLEMQERIKQLDLTLSKAEELSKITQGKTVKNEVATYGEHFGNEASKNKHSAWISFACMMASIFLTALTSLFLLNAISFDVSDKGVWVDLFNAISSQNILVKFVVISLGVYLITYFSKVHSAEKHLYNINIQKQNALESHKRMLDSVIATESENDKEIRNAILLELTKAIFDSKDTGYLKTSTQISSPVSQVINKWTDS